jgi:hypothetical protein
MLVTPRLWILVRPMAMAAYPRVKKVFQNLYQQVSRICSKPRLRLHDHQSVQQNSNQADPDALPRHVWLTQQALPAPQAAHSRYLGTQRPHGSKLRNGYLDKNDQTSPNDTACAAFRQSRTWRLLDKLFTAAQEPPKPLQGIWLAQLCMLTAFNAFHG